MLFFRPINAIDIGLKETGVIRLDYWIYAQRNATDTRVVNVIHMAAHILRPLSLARSTFFS